MKTVYSLLFFALTTCLWAQDDEYVSTDLDQQTVQQVFKKLDTEYVTDDECWRSWWLQTDQDRLRLFMPFSDANAWQQWHLQGKSMDVVISTVFSHDRAWTEWEWEGKQKIKMRTVFSGENAWKEWEVELNNDTEERLYIRPRFSSSDKAWQEWEIRHDDRDKGSIRVQTRFISGKDIWKTWDIIDEMPEVEAELKSAAIFCILFASIMPYAHPKGSCSFEGTPLKGRVKFVDYGEDFTIKYVNYDEDIGVEFVEWGADDCGEWQEVEYGEDFKVKVVDWNEDLKVKKVEYNPGMRDN
jgi:hypothetical protein